MPAAAAPTLSSTPTPSPAPGPSPPLHHDHDPGHLPLAELWLALYDLTHLPYSEQLRWRAQRCTAHATAPDAADIARTTWEPFNPRTHHQHIRHHLPAPSRPACQGRG
ncbi:hypothetical protein [Streptomyces sp. NPDC005336]|uniref:hypothetical protein n=1 Tax=Streptomyces sp. NPDC005336 TaxID=3157035 RepID=UPI0033B08A17